MNNDALSQILIIVLGVMIFILIVLAAIFIILKAKEKVSKEKPDELIGKQNKKEKTKSAIDTSYTKQSIMDFMEFDKVEDNMIIQNKRKKIFNGSRMSRR